MELTLGLLTAYLLGSIPFALLTVWLLAGVDLRKIGSGNVGASNAARAFGSRSRYAVFLLVYVLDFSKGFVAAAFLTQWFGLAETWHSVSLGAAAILGHCTSPFLGFRGGKGVATATGVACVLAPIPLGISLISYLLAMFLFRRAFVGSLVLVGVLNVAALLEKPAPFGADRLPITGFFLILFAFLLFTHRSNIRSFLQQKSSSS